MDTLTRKEEQILMAIHYLRDNAYLITIKEQIKIFTGKSYSVGTIYAPLNRLFLNGFLESRQEKIPEGKGTKPIRYYTISKKGYEALARLKRLNDGMWDNFVIPV